MRALLLSIVVVGSCGRAPGPTAAPEVPAPSDWSLVAPEVRGPMEEAIGRCRNSPGDAGAFAALGRLYHGNHAPIPAAAAYERALALGPPDAPTVYFLGLIREERGETPEALACFERARMLEPRYAPIHHHLGSVLLESGRPREAIAAFEEAVRLEPGDVAFHVGLARAHRQAGDGAKALAAVRRALSLDPDHLPANQVAALVLKEQGRPEEAAPHLARGRTYHAEIVRDPWFRDVQKLGATVQGAIVRAELFLENRKAESAARILADLARSHPERADVHVKLARALALSGDLGRARQAYERAIALEGADPGLRSELASILLDTGDLDGAGREAAAALAADPGLSDASVIAAAVRLRRGDAAGALAQIGPVVEAHPGLLLAQITHGDALFALGRPAEAIPAYQAALRLSPGLAYAESRLAEAQAAARGGAESR